MLLCLLYSLGLLLVLLVLLVLSQSLVLLVLSLFHMFSAFLFVVFLLYLQYLYYFDSVHLAVNHVHYNSQRLLHGLFNFPCTLIAMQKLYTIQKLCILASYVMHRFSTSTIFIASQKTTTTTSILTSYVQYHR